MSLKDSFDFNVWMFVPMKKVKSVQVTFIYDSELNQILKPCSFPEDGTCGSWLPLVVVQLWDRQQCWSWHRNGTEGVQNTAWPELSALYHSIQVPQKLHSAVCLENFFLTHFSCFSFSYLLLLIIYYCLFSYLLIFSF